MTFLVRTFLFMSFFTIISCLSLSNDDMQKSFPPGYQLWLNSSSRTVSYFIGKELEDLPVNKTESGALQIIDLNKNFHSKTFAVDTVPAEPEDLYIGLLVYYNNWASTEDLLPFAYRSDPWFTGVVTEIDNEMVVIDGVKNVTIDWLRVRDS